MDDFTHDVIARFEDFVSDKVQWQRRLWDIGSVASLRELREASAGVRLGALSPKALRWFADSVAGRIRNDPGLGDEQQRRAISELITRDLTEDGINFHALDLWIEDVQQRYLARWRDSIAIASAGRETVSRALASFLLGEGCSRQGLTIWICEQESEGGLTDIQSLFDRACSLAAAPPKTFDALLTFTKPPSGYHVRPPEWRDASVVSKWLHAQGFNPIRQHGGLLLTLRARDAYDAADQAAEIAGRLTARSAVGTRDMLEIGDQIYLPGLTRPVTASESRRAEVRAVERGQRLLDIDAAAPLDAALELLSYVNRSPDAVAAAAGWSAVESLLSGPGDSDKVVTADRLGALVACSWPRAELTTVAWARINQCSDQPDALADELRDAPSNRARGERVVEAIQNGEWLHLERRAERLAMKRIECLVLHPHRELRRIEKRAVETLRRFYRQRNLVVHGGRVSGRTLSLALRAGAPLIGAGLDRITHAALESDLGPLEIAARAQLEIARAGTPDSPSLTSLLE